MADKKKEKSEIFPFLEWENLFLYMFSTTADYETAQKSRTITLKLTWSALTNIRTYKAKTHSHVRVNLVPVFGTEVNSKNGTNSWFFFQVIKILSGKSLT